MSALGYILLFYIGFYFYRLAENYNKNKWFYCFLGIIFYLLVIFIYAFFLKLFYIEEINDFTFVTVAFKSFLIGSISVFFLFHLLNFKWSRKKTNR